MLNYLFRKKRAIGRGAYKQFVAMPIGTPRTSVRILIGIRKAVLVMSLSATFTLGLMFVKPELADDILALSPYADRSNDEEVSSGMQWSRIARSIVKTGDEKETQVSENAEPEERVAKGSLIEKKRVTEWIAKRYRVANDAARMLVMESYSAATETKLDPLLILSVMAIESRFNPYAESPVGAQGLMQVMSKVHSEKFDDHGGVKAALNPVANIKVGAQILEEYVRRGGSVEAGLKSYVGAAMHRTDGGYGAKVMSEYSKLKLVARGKYVPITAKTVLMQAKHQDSEDESMVEADQEETIASSEEEKIKSQM